MKNAHDSDADPQEEEGGDRFLKPSSIPKNFLPKAEDESSAFRSLDEENESEEGEGDFLKKMAVSADFKPIVENESKAFRSLGSQSEDEEVQEEEKAAAKEKIPTPAFKKDTKPYKTWKPRRSSTKSGSKSSDEEKKSKPSKKRKPKTSRKNLTKSWKQSALAGSPISDGTRSPGWSAFLVECECCECCPYHQMVEDGKKKTKSPKSGRRSSLSERSSKMPVKRENRRRVHSVEIDCSDRRPEAILRNMFARIFPDGCDDKRMAFVSQGMANVMYDSGVWDEENDESEE